MTWNSNASHEEKVGVIADLARLICCAVRDHRVNSFKINALIFDILPYKFVSH